jgi:hypothetical protein
MRRKRLFIIFFLIIILIVFLCVLYLIMIQKEEPEEIIYGVSFNPQYARNLGLDAKNVYSAIIDDLGVKNIRLSAQWDLIEPKDNDWNFEELDYQMKIARQKKVNVILAIGKRLPRWPECHVPNWAHNLSKNEEQQQVKEYMEKVVNRYKNYDNIIMWQVENEPFLSFYATDYCKNFDSEFLEEEIELVKELDSKNKREVLVTGSDNLSFWVSPYRAGDVFGTTLYLYVWNKNFGSIKNWLPPSWYRMKGKAMEWFFGKKEIMAIEVSIEPWFDKAIIDFPVELQVERMSLDKFDEIIKYAKETRMEKQYLWGVEWWYYLMVEKGKPYFWQKAREIFK